MSSATHTLPVRDHIYYPDSDGKPLGETPRHVRNCRVSLGLVERWFADDPNVYVGGNMFVYYVIGDPSQSVCPDLFAVKGVPKQTEPERRTYRTWEENGKGPDFITEFTSRSTRREDTQTKMALYRDTLKVKEYFLFDPHGEYLKPPLQGYRLSRGHYLRIKPVRGRLPSRVLGLHLEAEGDLLRFWNPETGRLLPLEEEMEAGWERAEAERQRAQAERQRAEAGWERAEAERTRMETELYHAETERQAEADARRRAEGEIERLKRELDELRRRPPAP